MHPATRVSMPAAAVLCVLPGVNVVEGCFPTRDGSRCKPMRRASQHRHLPTSVLWAATWALFVSGAMAADWWGYPNMYRSLCDDGNGGHDHGTCLTAGCLEHREYWNGKDCRNNAYNDNGNYAYHVQSNYGKCYGCYRCNVKDIDGGYDRKELGERHQHVCAYTCEDGYYVNGNGCTQCSACNSNCAVCSDCTKGSGYWYKNMEDDTTGISGTSGSSTRPCSTCKAGTYKSSSTCVSCSKGTYRPEAGHTYTTCQTCSSGTEQNSAGDGCTNCQPGQWRLVQQQQSDLYGCTAHRSCTGSVEWYIAGTRTSDTVCRCRAGYYRSAGGTGLTGFDSIGRLVTETCTAASVGYYVSLSGQASQTPCPAGSFTDTTASTLCQSGSVCGGTLTLTHAIEGSVGCECAAGYHHETPTGLAPTQRCHKCVGGFSEPVSTHCSPWWSSAPIPATLTPTCSSTKQLVGTVPAGASDAGAVFPYWTDLNWGNRHLTMETQGSSSLAHLAADVEMYVPMTGSISGESDQRHALTDPSKVPRSFARFVAPSTITGLQPPSNLEGVQLYLPFDTDFYDHSIHEALVAYSTTGNLKEVVDDRRWVVGGGSLRQERDYYARVFDAATVADITAFKNSFSHLPYVLSCPLYSFDFTYYTEYRVLDLRCGQQPDIGNSGAVHLEIDIPGTFPVDWKGVIYAGGWSSSPDTVSEDAAGEVTNGMELWSRPVGQTEWTLLGAQLSGRGVTGTRKFDYGITVSNALTVETEFKVKIKAFSVGPHTNVRLSYLDVHSSNALTHIANILHSGTPSKLSIAFWFVPQIPGGINANSAPFGYTAPSLNHNFGWQGILGLSGMDMSLTNYNAIKMCFGTGQTNCYWSTDIPMKVGEWQHVAATMDFDTREINCYINGTRSSNFGNALVYGATVIGGGEWYSRTQLDEFYVFDRILSQEEVSHLASQWAPSTAAAIFTGAEYVDFGAPGNTPRCHASTAPDDCVVHTVRNAPSHSFHVWFKRSNAWETTATKNDVVFHISPYQNQENGGLTLKFQGSGMVVEYRDCWNILRQQGRHYAAQRTLRLAPGCAHEGRRRSRGVRVLRGRGQNSCQRLCRPLRGERTILLCIRARGRKDREPRQFFQPLSGAHA